MAKKEYKALLVDEPTHNKVAVLAKKKRMTVDALLLYLLRFHEKTSKQN